VDVAVGHTVVVRNLDDLSHLTTNPAAVFFSVILQSCNIVWQHLYIRWREFLNTNQPFVVLFRAASVRKQSATELSLRHENIESDFNLIIQPVAAAIVQRMGRSRCVRLQVQGEKIQGTLDWLRANEEQK